jgi:EAL domain-containing protein (putative c-di-GMP-specific phosphodiesterase class I)/CHASE2 domain-containing sensor protein/GGDEF domain-containing protein
VPPNHDWSGKPLSFVAAFLVALTALVLNLAGVFDPVEDEFTSARAELLSRQPSGETVIVEIDARSLAQLRSWPWPRGYHAEAVRQLDKAGASIIAFDVDFSAVSHSGDDELSSAIRDAGHVVLPIFQQKSSDRIDDRQMLVSKPNPAFGDAWVGGVNIFPDADGVVREYPAATFIGGAVQPSIAALVAENDDLGTRSFQPDWAIDARRIPRFSFVDLMHGRVPAEALRGKRVLIGATAVELGDRYAVPRFGMIPGVVVQALATETLLQDRAISMSGPAATILGVIVLALLLRPRPLARPARYIAFCTAAAVAVGGGPILVQSAWPVSIASAAWLFTVIASAGVQGAVEAKRRLRLRAHFDADSGLPNRSMLEKALGAEVGAGSVLVMAAIERFDVIRDAMGIAATNQLVRIAAAKIGELVGAPVHRIAPDLLAWVQPGDEEKTVQELPRSIDETFRSPVTTEAGPVDVAFTLGLDRHQPGDTAVLRVEHALSAIGRARSTGKSHAWYGGSDPIVRRQLSMMSALREAMDTGKLRLAYQPKMALASGHIADAEALVRWDDGQGNLVSPDEFIPLAEETGVIREVTLFALRSAMSDLARWAQRGITMRVAVNVSAVDLASASFIGEVDALLCESGLSASQLALEVTESALIRSPAEAIATMNALRDRGIRLSVDDYGTGQSTLSYVKHLPVNELKIDKSFVTSLSQSENDAIMVRSTINLAHELGLEVVAEGVEDRATLDKLRQLGCDYVQGYFIGKAVGPDELALLASSPVQPRLVA